MTAPPGLRDLFTAFMQSTVSAVVDLPPPGQPVWMECVPDKDDDRQRMGRPRGSKGKKPALTQAERNAKRADRIASKQRRDNILILDFETEPFDHILKTLVKPFLCVVHSPKLLEMNMPTDPKYPDCVVMWDEDDGKLIQRISDLLASLPQKFTVYAHNGGRFDYMFLLSRLIRGRVAFKGRGIMSAEIHGHAIRDSLLIVPERLANIQKEAFDYHNMQRAKRSAFRDEIIRYCVSDCRSLFSIVTDFIGAFGPKLTIGQAALAELKKHYPIKRLTEWMDEYLRRYYFGGRVECIKGAGHFVGKYKIFDINSSYPNVMARFKHPVGDFYDYQIRTGVPGNNTCFIDLECDNRGALIGKDAEGRTTAQIPHGRFYTTIHEYEVACRYNLISNVKINFCVDCKERTTFADFVLPRYERRQIIKAELKTLKERGLDGTEAWYILTREGIFIKLILNSAYGKTGQNPRRFMDHYLTEPSEFPDPEWLASLEYLSPDDQNFYGGGPYFKNDDYAIWQKPAPRHSYNNVGVAASVTGAALAVLLEAMQHAKGAIYCDTDSLICEDLPAGGPIDIDEARLGAWHLEDTASEVIILAKKTYGLWHEAPKRRTLAQLNDGVSPDYTIKCKGASGLTWHNLDPMLNGERTLTTNRAPTLDRYGNQRYIDRYIRATAAPAIGV
jgi:DNA polymerase elongation subunit (family B)